MKIRRTPPNPAGLRWGRAALLAWAAGGLLGAGEPDSARERRAWERIWFGGEPGPAYLDHHVREGRRLERPRAIAAGSAAVPRWVSLGPSEAGARPFYCGRLNAILTHPTEAGTLYVGTSGGGLWKATRVDPATDAPWDWTPLTDALPTALGNLPVGALAMDPADPDRIYLGLGDAFEGEGRGFFISRNGGSSWEAAGGLGDATRVLAILPLGAGRILVGTNQGLWRSEDGGLSFRALSLDAVPGGGWVWEIRVLGPRLLLSRQLVQMEAEHGPVALPAGGSNHVGELAGPGQIWISEDQGATWRPALLDASVTALRGGRISFGTCAADPSRAYGLIQAQEVVAPGLLRSLDGGLSWSFQALPPSTGLFAAPQDNQWNGWYNQLISVDPASADRLFVGTTLALYRSEDGGRVWTRVDQAETHPDFHATAWSQAGPACLYLGNDGGLSVVGNPRGVVRMDDGRNGGLSTLLANNVGSTVATAPADSRFRVVLGAQDNASWVRSAGPGGLANSTAFREAWEGDGFGCLIHPSDGNQILVSAQYNDIGRSTDGGLSFQPSGFSAPSPFHTRLVRGPADPTGDTVYAVGLNAVYRSLSFGAAWSPLPTEGLPPDPQIRAVGASPTDPAALAVVCNRNAAYRFDGARWSPLGALPGSAGSLSCIAFDPQDPKGLYAASVALDPGANHLWASGDGGLSWRALDGQAGASRGLPFGTPVHLVQADPRLPGRLYAGTDFGLFQSLDGGQSWEPFGEGLPRTAVRDLYVAPDGTFLRAATYGRGVWELPLVFAFTSFAVLPGAATVEAGSATAFRSLAQGSGHVNPAAAWAVTAGRVTPSGVFVAPSLGGPVILQATSLLDPAWSATARIQVIGSADLDRDGVRDVLDLAVLARAYGSRRGDPEYQAEADLDGDGGVDDGDLGLLLARIP